MYLTNLYQPPEERRVKYRALRLAGFTPHEARRCRDWTYGAITAYFGDRPYLDVDIDLFERTVETALATLLEGEPEAA